MNVEAPEGFPWELTKPLHQAHGFRLSGVGLAISLSYLDYGHSYMLVAFIEVAGQPLNLWRKVTSPKASAVEAAEDLAAAAEEYIRDLRLVVRPVEDLDYDDFLEHIRLRVEGMFH